MEDIKEERRIGRQSQGSADQFWTGVGGGVRMKGQTTAALTSFWLNVALQSEPDYK